jgi:hypothetical protein
VATIMGSLLDLAEVRLFDGLPKQLQDVFATGRPIPGLA